MHIQEDFFIKNIFTFIIPPEDGLCRLKHVEKLVRIFMNICGISGNK